MVNMDTVPIMLDNDIGGDIDDFLALYFLLGHPKANLVGVTIYKGRKDQVSLVKWLLGQCDVDIPVGTFLRTGDDRSGVSNRQH